ncbi:radical SAM protein [bacterium]|nr:radical SAM protein [bacterium]
MPISPHFAIPSLMGQFEGSGHNVSAIDVNLEFYCEVLTQKYISKSIKIARELEKELFKEISTFYERTKSFETYPMYQKNKMAKHVLIKTFFQKHEKEIHNIPTLIEGAVSVLRSKKHFYNPKLLLQSLNIIDLALQIVSMPYYPSIISLGGYQNQHFKLDFENIKYYVFDKDTNIFIDFYQKLLPKIKEKNADYIGVAINASSQIIPGLTLANLLKKETSAHINIGGNYFTRLTDTLEKYPEFFRLFAHSVTVEEGEKPVLELADYIAGNRKLEEVSNLLYLRDEKVVQNPITIPTKLDNLKPVSLEGFELKKYFLPEIIMPFQSSRGCYWRKCSFCDHDFGMHYNIKKVDKLIEQIKELKEKYNISKFEFIDEAISPSYLDAFSDMLKEENLDISFFCDARLESEFSKELLTKARSAGLKMMLWGLESGSKKIMDLINKGVDFEDRMNVLKNASDADIFNFAFIFFGFPAETREDALKTIDLICNNKKIINAYGKSIFTMGKHTKLRENPQQYGVIGEPYQEEEFSPTYTYEASGMNKKELNEIVELCTKRALDVYGNGLIFQLITRELLFLYIDKYGIDWVENYRFN